MRQPDQSPAGVRVRLSHFVHIKVLIFSRWDPRHTPFTQLVNEMVDMDVKSLKRGSDLADIPSDPASVAGISQAAVSPKP